MAVEIPLIDLRLAGAAPEESARLRAACERLGCFRVTGHGVPGGLLAEMKAAVRALFDLPDDAKRRNADVIPGSGYVAPSATNPLYEAFGLLDAAAPADVDAFFFIEKRWFPLYFQKTKHRGSVFSSVQRKKFWKLARKTLAQN